MALVVIHGEFDGLRLVADDLSCGFAVSTVLCIFLTLLFSFFQLDEGFYLH